MLIKLVKNYVWIYISPDKVYVLTATNRIAMRFVVRSAPPFHYLTKCSDNAKGGI